MAERKKPETAPQLQGAVKDYPVPSVALSKGAFDTIVRLIKRGRISQVEQIRDLVGTNMKRLRMRSKGVEGVKGTPEGSDQVNVGGIIAWANGIKKRDKPAKEQLKLLAATLRERFK